MCSEERARPAVLACLLNSLLIDPGIVSFAQDQVGLQERCVHCQILGAWLSCAHTEVEHELSRIALST